MTQGTTWRPKAAATSGIRFGGKRRWKARVWKTRHYRESAVALAEEGVKEIFPAGVVDGPVHASFALGDEVVGPNLAVALVVGDVEAVDNGHAAGEFGLRFDIEEMVGMRSDK